MLAAASPDAPRDRQRAPALRPRPQGRLGPAVRAAVTALLAFHALRAGEIRHLTLTDIRDLDTGLLHLPGRTVHLAEPARVRLAAYLAHRRQCWPHTANQHVFVTSRTALTTTPASRPWLYRQQPLSSGLRDDRILDEVQAAHTDTRMVCELFGLSMQAAIRYTATRPDTERPSPQQGPTE